MTDVFEIAKPQSSCGGISDIAAKLGVRPYELGDGPTTLMEGKDGKNYDVFKVVGAFLERMDQRLGDAQSPDPSKLLQEAVTIINHLLNTAPTGGSGSFDMMPLIVTRDRAEVFLHNNGLRRFKTSVEYTR